MELGAEDLTPMFGVAAAVASNRLANLTLATRRLGMGIY